MEIFFEIETEIYKLEVKIEFYLKIRLF